MVTGRSVLYPDLLQLELDTYVLNKILAPGLLSRRESRKDLWTLLQHA